MFTTLTMQHPFQELVRRNRHSRIYGTIQNSTYATMKGIGKVTTVICPILHSYNSEAALGKGGKSKRFLLDFVRPLNSVIAVKTGK